MDKRVPLTIYKNSERIVIGSAYVEESGIVTGRIDDPDVAEKLGITSSDDISNLSVHFSGTLALDKPTPDEAAVIPLFKLKEESMDPKTGKLYDSIDEAKADGVKNPVEISGRKKEIAFVSDALSAADKKRRKKQKKNAKATRKRNR